MAAEDAVSRLTSLSVIKFIQRAQTSSLNAIGGATRQGPSCPAMVHDTHEKKWSLRLLPSVLRAEQSYCHCVITLQSGCEAVEFFVGRSDNIYQSQSVQIKIRQDMEVSNQ